ncbi:MAG: hypothetical protein EPN64_04660 [Burkholderiaceae bacterium]|nr:MAG: hypothetical protein EPN64_04660 [Burkholderiaceae bacterium]
MPHPTQPQSAPSAAPDAGAGPKRYIVEAHGGGDLDWDGSPSVAVFQVDEALARDIIRFSSLVKAENVYKIERFDCHADFLRYDPETNREEALEAGEKNSVRTECDVLVVTGEDFFFRAYVKHTDVEIECEGQPISALAQHFGLAPGDRSVPEAVRVRLEQALPGADGYERGFKDALESIALALAAKISRPVLDEAIATAMDAYANNADTQVSEAPASSPQFP